jgi:ABC-type antimicrobial peptide transport system permease subunit
VILGAFALLLASIGLGGVTAYAVARRSKEIGIRMAVGATVSQVRKLVLSEASALLVVGAGMAMLACYLPARRTTRIEPASALRRE